MLNSLWSPLVARQRLLLLLRQRLHLLRQRLLLLLLQPLLLLMLLLIGDEFPRLLDKKARLMNKLPRLPPW